MEENMRKLKIRWTFLMVGFLMGGCMLPPQAKIPLGSAVRATMAQQIADPRASDRQDKSLGLEGRAAAGLMERYYSGFGEKAKPQAGPSTK